jgi:cell division transport system permease protein
VPYSLREALAAFRRSPLLVLLSIVAIALSLFVAGLFGLTAYNIRLAIDHLEDRVEVVGYLADGFTEEQLRQAQLEVRELPEVLEVSYVSREAALAAAIQDLAEFREVYANLEVNPLPASLEVRLRPGHRSPESVERVARFLTGLAIVDDVRFGREWIERIFSLRRVAAGGAGILGGAFALVAVVVIAAAVRIAVFARREEISIMRLVGATNGFVRLPYLLEGLLAGVLGGSLSLVLTYAAYTAIDSSFIRLAWLPPLWIGTGLVSGIALGLLAAAVAVHRHLKAV